MTRAVRRLAPLAVLAAAASCVVAVPSAGAAAAPTTTHGGLPVGLHHVDPNLARPAGAGGKVANEQSENWSGYIKSGSGFSSSTASWTVPSVSTQDNGYSSSWVGIDGATSGDQYLIQTGTEQDVENGRTNYDAWWEVITPSDEAPEQIFSNLSISPGDSITASVSKGSGGTWTMTLTDNTTGQSGTHSSGFAGPGDSAEWIQEDTDVNGDISTAPDWGSVTFSGITVNGANPDLASASAVDIVDSQGTQEDSTGAPNASGDGFTVQWLATGTETPTG